LNRDNYWINQKNVKKRDNFLDKDQVVLKINNYEAKYNNNEPINVIYLDESIYSYNKDGELLKFDLNNGKIPLLTTKKVAWKTCLKELFWFIKGDTNNEHTLYASHSIWNSKNDFINWTKSEAFRLAHKNSGQHKGLYLGHPNFEGFEVVI